ncbi:T9SS type A sorting domain-containing protein [Flavobacterium sp. CYK-4]|uniref:T9SS type A sorting domain-containing protein n=1 Tax=Flavobacterium lotistagni TaxID=2709660 RepID=UPI00140E1DD4|nr:T9SS type A sorting domain-containing protein [Flavobacterium lotistagni]NHM05615.1 T9SS type A sorting domain-containing protein [Flavobacterium lotistagni]
MKKLLLLTFILGGFASNAQQVFWEEKSTGFLTPSTNETDISYAPNDPNVVWIYASAGDGSGDFYQEWGRSTDGGETWTVGNIEIGSTDLAIGDICAINATTAYIAVFPNGAGVTGGIWITTDSGATWQRQNTASYNTGTESFANIVHFWDAQKGMTMGDPASGYFEIYTTTNGGTNWTRVPSANIPAPLDGEYGYTHNFEVYNNVLWFQTNKGRVYKSTDFGLTWTVTQSPLTDWSGDAGGGLAMKDENNGIIVAQDFRFFRTSDGGVTWNPEVPNGYFRNFEVAFVPGTQDFYVTTGEDPDGIGRGSSYSYDGGLNWIDINETDEVPNDGANSLSFYDPTNGLSGGFTASSVSGGIWKWIANALSTSSFSKDKAYSAFINSTTGNLEVNGKNISSISVFDVLGKQVYNGNFASVDTVAINANNFNSGIYLVKVTNNAGAASTVKVVKN